MDTELNYAPTTFSTRTFSSFLIREKSELLLKAKVINNQRKYHREELLQNCQNKYLSSVGNYKDI